MKDDIHRRLQSTVSQLGTREGEQDPSIRQLQLDLWAYRDQQIAANAAVANLEWRLIQFDNHAKGLESELARVRLELSNTKKVLAAKSAEAAEVRLSWTFRIGRAVMVALWPVRFLLRRTGTHHNS